MATPCGNNINCGCKDTYLTSPAPCPTPADCPDAQPCSEVFDAQCVIYTGADLVCNATTLIDQNTAVDQALENIISYFCTNTVIVDDIFCREDFTTDTLVVPEGTAVSEAVELVVGYFCQRFFFPANITCGEDIVVTAGVNIQQGVAELNEYYCTEVEKRTQKFVKEWDNIVFDNQTVVILNSELAACNMISQPCGSDYTAACDFNYSIYYLFDTSWISIGNLDGVTVSANNITGDISINLDIAPIDPPVKLRAVIIG